MTNDLIELALRGGPPPRGLEQVYALSLWKCLAQPYLARSLDRGDAMSCFLTTYAHLLDTLSFAAFEQMNRCEVLLYSQPPYRITVKLEHFIPNEGEVTLHLRDESVALYDLSFTVVPGRCVGAPVPRALLVTRMQGRRGEGERLGAATAAFGDITPQHLLFSAMVGIAAACRIETALGVAALNQISYKVSFHDLFTRAYDRFYTEVSGVDRGDGFFRLPMGDRGRPLSEVVSWHRRRTRRKREVKRALSVAVQAAWERLAAVDPEPARPSAPDTFVPT